MEENHLLVYLQSITMLLLVIDPPGLVPIYVALTKKLTKKERMKLLNKSIIVGFFLLSIFTFFGSAILLIFKIDVHDFRIAGGFLLLIISLQIIFSSDEKEMTKHYTGLVPIAVPLLAGPGAVTATIVISSAEGILHTHISIIFAFLVSFIILKYGHELLTLLGNEFTDVITKIIGILLAAISIHFIREGIIGIINSYIY